MLQFKRGTPLCGPVVVGGESVDPFKLYKAVTNKGGAHVVGPLSRLKHPEAYLRR